MRSVPIFCYHNVSDVDGHTPALFEAHLAAIQQAGYRTIGCRELLDYIQGKKPLAGPSCMLTFDDGHLSNWLVAAPLLRKYGMTGVFFALADFTVPGPARSGRGAPALAPMPESFRQALAGDVSQFMNESELKALIQDFGMEVQAHGRRHQGAFRSLRPQGAIGAGGHWAANGIYPEPAAGLPCFDVGSALVYDGFWPGQDGPGAHFRLRPESQRRAFCRDEFRESLARLSALNGGGPQFFCWPWGQFDAVSEEELRVSGFAGAFSLERGANAPGTDPFRLKRLGVGKKKSPAWIRTRLAMYGNALTAKVFFKYFRKRPEPRSVLLATDSTKLSGGSRQMINNARALSDMGLTVLAAVPPQSVLRGAMEEAGARVLPWDGFHRVWDTARFFQAVWREQAVDVVHVFHNKAYKPAILARLLGARFRLFMNRGVIFKPNALAALWAALSDGYLCNSLACARVLRRYGVLKCRLSVVYNSFLNQGQDPGEVALRKKRGVRVIYVGNAAPAKGLDVFLEVLTLLEGAGKAKDMEFVVCGASHTESLVQGMSPAALGRLRFTGSIPHAEVLAELAQADIFVLSSRQESLPNALLEGFMAGLPAVATSVGGVPELIRHGVNGMLCTSEDAICLAEAVTALAGEPLRRVHMGRINRRLVRELLDNWTKGRNLVRVYAGERLFAPLAVEQLAVSVPLPEAGECGCPDAAKT